MTKKIFAAINEYGLISANDSIIVGFSGGADSVTLLHFLSGLKEKMNLNILAAHVNHCLRGEDSDNDEKFARDFCNKLSIPIEVLKVDIFKLSKESGCGLEECGRNIRYDFFNKLADKTNAKIATAHTLSDSVETIILNLTRGAGINGMCGIPAKRGNIIRPLIFSTREDIEKYCRENELEFVTDKSNFDKSYSRNKIRLDVIPVLKEINSSLEQTVMRMTKSIKEDSDYLDSLAEKNLLICKLDKGYDLSIISKLDKAILSRCIRKIVLNECKVNIENIHTELIIEKIKEGFGTVTLPGKIYVDINDGLLSVTTNKTAKIKDKLWEYNINQTKILTESKREFIIKVIDKNEYQSILKNSVTNAKTLFTNTIAYDNINENTVIRNRRNSDRFKKAGRGVTKTLKKLFNEEKIPVEERNNIPIIANNNEVLWIEGFGVSESAMIKPDTEKMMVIFKKESSLC